MTTASLEPVAVTGSARSLAPDLARGAMLLLIVLANTPWYLYGSATSGSSIHPADGSVLDRAVQAVIITTVDMRVYPMFAFLFGYGIVQLYRRQTATGAADRDVRRVLRRRHLWLLLFGALHAALLWFGDILGAYGLLGLIMVAVFLRRRDTTLKVWAIVLGSLIAVGTLLAVAGAIALSTLPTPAGDEPVDFLGLVVSINGIESWPASVLPRLSFWPFLVLGQGLFSLVVPVAMLLAFLAARHEVLERPEEHRTLLVRLAVVGVGTGWTGGLLSALYHLGLLEVPAQSSWVFSVVGVSTGLVGGIGYVAVFGLLAIALRGRREAGWVRALTAVGKRSLSSYLAQSLVCAPLLAAWGLGLGGVLGSAGVALLATGVWSTTLVAAVLAERAGLRGPAEAVLRRLSYGASRG